MPAAKHSQYSFRQRLFLQLQPRRAEEEGRGESDTPGSGGLTKREADRVDEGDERRAEEEGWEASAGNGDADGEGIPLEADGEGGSAEEGRPDVGWEEDCRAVRAEAGWAVERPPAPPAAAVGWRPS